MEACPQLDQARDPAPHRDASLVRVHDPGKKLKGRALAAAVVADQADRLPLPHIEADVIQHHALLKTAPEAEQGQFLHRIALVHVHAEFLLHVGDFDCIFHFVSVLIHTAIYPLPVSCLLNPSSAGGSLILCRPAALWSSACQFLISPAK